MATLTLRRCTPAIALSILTFCLGEPALSQSGTPVGQINATIGDEAYSGETLDVPSEGTATADFRSLGPITNVTVQGHDPEADSIMRNVLSVEISLMGKDSAAPVTQASVSYWPQGMNAPFYISEGSGTETEVVLESLSLDDGASSVKGSFSALMCRQEDFFSEADTSDCLPVEGTFDTALRKAD